MKKEKETKRQYKVKLLRNIYPGEPFSVDQINAVIDCVNLLFEVFISDITYCW